MKGLLVVLAVGACCVLTVKSANISDEEKGLQTEELGRNGGGGGGGGGWGPGGGGGGGWGAGGGGGGVGGGSGGGGWGAQEAFSGPPAVVFALPIAIGLIVILWIAAYNTLRSPPPKIGFGAGAQGSGPGGWGQANYGWGVGPTAAGGWGAPVAAGGGWAAAGSQVYPEYADLSGGAVGGETVAAGSSPQQAATVAAAVEQTVAGSGSRSFGDLTHRVLRSVEHQY